MDLVDESGRYHISSLAWEWLQQAGADSAFKCQIELWDVAGIPVNNLWSAGWKKVVGGSLDRAFSGVNNRRCIRTVSDGHTDITQRAMRRIRGRTVAFHDERLD